MKGNTPLFDTRSYKSVSGDISFMGKGDRSLFAKYVSKRKDVDVDGSIDVIAHGNATYIEIDSGGKNYKITARDAAKLIRKANGYENYKSIRLLSCNTGKTENGFAQNLANALGKPVYAPNNYVWANYNGHHYIAGKTSSGKPDLSSKGEFIKYIPGGYRNGK